MVSWSPCTPLRRCEYCGIWQWTWLLGPSSGPGHVSTLCWDLCMYLSLSLLPVHPTVSTELDAEMLAKRELQYRIFWPGLLSRWSVNRTLEDTAACISCLGTAIYTIASFFNLLFFLRCLEQPFLLSWSYLTCPFFSLTVPVWHRNSFMIAFIPTEQKFPSFPSI